MDSDNEKMEYYEYNDFVNDVCEKCGYETNTNTHYENCEVDTKMIENAKKWVRYLEYQDNIILELHRLTDEGYFIYSSTNPNKWLINRLAEFEKYNN